MTLLAAYVSGHGFGHATRTAEVLRALRASAPDLDLAVVSSAPESLFRSAIDGPLLYRRRECDVGLVQHDALTIDEAATAIRAREFAAHWPAFLEEERLWLREVEASLVLGDIPPIAFAAASAAGLPAVGLANFSWDWIYRHLAAREAGLAEAARLAAEAYGHAELLLRLPFAGDLRAFPRVVDVPLVARCPQVGKEEARRRLGLGAAPAVLLSFGGIGLPGFRTDALKLLPDFQFLVPDRALARAPNASVVDAAGLASLGLGYVDLVGAADVVVTKPGYGIVTDAIGAATRVVYTDRGDFPEYPIMVAEMGRYLPCAYVSNEDLYEGRLRQPIEAVLAEEFPGPPRLEGAEIVAQRLLDML